MTVIITPIFQGLGFFFVGLERTFGWSRDKLSLPFSMARAEGALMGPIEGYVVDRYGSRKTVIFGLFLLSSGFLSFSFVQNFAQFFIAFLVITAGGAFGGFMPFIAAINNWFRRNRAKAMAFGMMGISLGGFLAPAIGLGIDTFGWRWVARDFGIAIALLAIPIGLMVRNRPEDYGLLPDGDKPEDIDPDETGQHEEVSSSVGNALKTRGFWLVATCHGLSAMSPVTLSIHLVPALNDAGWSLAGAGWALVVMSTTTGLFQMLGGILGDKVRKEPAIFVAITIQATGVFILALGVASEATPTILLGVALYGGGLGSRVPLITAIRGDYFGRNSFGTIMGASQIPMNIIMFGAPWAAGWLFEVFKSYTVPFMALSAFNFLGGIIMLFSKHPDLASIPSPMSRDFWMPAPERRSSDPSGKMQ
jgi:MFS family permease